MRKFLLAAALAGGAFTATPALADDSGLTATTGVDWSRGDYGTNADTEIVVVPFSLRYKTGDVRLTATLPWLRIDGSSAIVGDGRGGTVLDPNAPRSVRSGLGDVSLGVAWGIPEEPLGFGLDLSGRVKLPTAERSRGLGTGATDVSVGAELSRSFGALTPFVSVGYRMPGDPDGIDLHNAWNGSVGASVALGSSVLVASYDYREATSNLAYDSEELFGAFSTPLSEQLNLTVYGSAGLSRGAPDIGVGSMIAVRF